MNGAGVAHGAALASVNSSSAAAGSSSSSGNKSASVASTKSSSEATVLASESVSFTMSLSVLSFCFWTCCVVSASALGSMMAC